MGSNILLYGASGHCKVIMDSVFLQGDNVEAVLDDNPKKDAIYGVSIVNPKEFKIDAESLITISIGDNKIRKAISEKVNARFHTVIHPTAILSKHSSVGEGTVIMAGVIINPDSFIGKHCILNTGAVIDHDCTIGDYAHISPNASLAGDVSVGEGSHIGIGASVIQGVKIGKWAIIGAGSVVLKDIEDYAVVVGNPARIIKYTEKI